MNAIQTVAQIVQVAAKLIIKIAVIAAKIVMVVFGVPFEEEYHADIQFDQTTGGGGASFHLTSVYLAEVPRRY